ncbi:unnamed protein product [Cercopithifilaria johnstoni]|uniref:Uncharacterized protein n=1 Tax=Cercopithifilaria johnstoni TaxID=2874296 RepID=A0A8J2PUB5_9BILA|nr:unnamed protein product [Cercopithifilaria johnstoni]
MAVTNVKYWKRNPQATNVLKQLNWIAENEVRIKSMWLRRDGFSVRLMARTKEPPVNLVLSLDSCFNVRILRIDYTNGFVFVYPLAEDD